MARFLVTALAACLGLVEAAVEVRKTNRGPTGYEVTITYTNSSVNNVQIGALPHFTDQYRTTFTYAAQFDPHDYKPGDFLSEAASSPRSVYQMTNTGNGCFEFTTPLPSGTYQYNFLLDCANVTACTQASGQQVTDPENPPYETVKGSQMGSPFQVPYDARFQYYPELNLDFDYTLPIADASKRGTLKKDLYPSAGAVTPKPGIHDFIAYLPAGYSNTSSEPYPLLYLSHGGGGAAGDWQNQAYMSHIMDRLIEEKYIEPTVVVMPSFSGLVNSSQNPPANVVRPLYQQYLFPYVEANYHVSKDPNRRAFAGLSLGSVLTYEMYINATDYFGYYGFFSGALLPGHELGDYVNRNLTARNPALLNRGITVGYGQFDIAFDDTKLLQEALDSVGVKYVSRFVPWGFHWWNTWQDTLWTFGRTTLWKPRPFSDEIGHVCATLVHGMTDDTIRELRRDTRDLFYHGYTNYMKHAFPEDELRPISCKPQTRNKDNPADIGLNDVLGNYSVTLVDSLSSLAILASGKAGEDKHKPLKDFQEGVAALVELYGDGGEKKPCGTKACGFELDSKVQVFETNIRGVGGLLSAHLFAVGELPIRGYEPKWVKGKDGGLVIKWPKFAYDGQLLRLAYDLASRLLPAFETQTGLPYPRVNLKHGIPFYRDSADGICRLDGTSSDPREITETCAAGAGSLVLEFTTLSRLTGDERFEILAKRAFWAVWERRSAIGLLGNGLDAENGQWTMPPLSGIGAGIDSFFEYAVKSSILLSGLPDPSTAHPLDAPESFLRAWEEAHAAVKRHVRRSPASDHAYYGQADLITGAPRYSWIDNLSAYYPGLLSLAGELDEAIESHLLFAALWTRYGALPERWHAHNAFIDPNFKHWAGRPEFIESTYYLYQATKDPFYLHVGEMALRDIRRRCWTPCGWSDLSDVVSGEQRDRQESFFLGETAKYLYLLFEANHPLNKMDAPVVFSTEGHPLIIPPKLRSANREHFHKPTNTGVQEQVAEVVPAPTCPAHHSFDAFSGSSIVSRHDFFHAAALAQLHLVPVQLSRSSSLHEASNDGPAVSMEDLRSPTNYTYYPWTLPQNLVPQYGFSSAIKSPVVSTLTFPNMHVGDVAAEKGLIPLGSLQKVLDGIVINSLSNLRLNMVQEPKSLLLPDGDGVLVQMEVGQQYRVQGIANWALGRDEKVLLAKEALDGVAPGDPNFKRVKDLEMVDLVLDFVPSSLPPGMDGTDGEDDFDEWDLEVPVPENSTTDASIWDDIESMVTSLLSGSESAAHEPSTTALSLQPTLSRTILPAILPTGAGATPLPAHVDSSLDPLKLPSGSLSFGKIYFLASTLCNFRLPTHIARGYQILVIQRGECSFNDKLANIPAYAPAAEALQVVIVVSPPTPESQGELIRPLLDERQKTPAGFERRHGIAMMMVEGNDGAMDALIGAASVVGEMNDGGEIIEERVENGPFEGVAKGKGRGIGVKRRYWFESMGVPIGNLIPL